MSIDTQLITQLITTARFNLEDEGVEVEVEGEGAISIFDLT